MSARLVLASASPQRRNILGGLGLAFEVRPTDAPELESGDAAAVALENARRKAAVAAAHPDARPGDLVLACDTVVATEAGIWGKPADEERARATLRHLSGRDHEVVGGLVLLQDGEEVTAVERTIVTFRELDDDLLDWYLGCGEWEGRAGGYAIQGRGAALVRRIGGDYLNVVGLPVAALLDLRPTLLREFTAGA